MIDKIDVFIAEIKSRPEFIVGAAADPQKHADLAAMKVGIDAIRKQGDAAGIEILDKISALVCRNDLSIRQRLDSLMMLLLQACDCGNKLH